MEGLWDYLETQEKGDEIWILVRLRIQEHHQDRDSKSKDPEHVGKVNFSEAKKWLEEAQAQFFTGQVISEEKSEPSP